MDDIQYTTHITAAQTLEYGIKCLTEACRKIVLRVSVLVDIRFQEQSTQRRRKGERIDSRYAHGNRHRDTELGIERPGSAAHHCHRDKHRHKDNGRGENGGRNALHGIIGGKYRRLVAFVELRLHRLHHHDGIVHHRADGKHKGEKREQVDGKAYQRHHGKRADDGDEDGNRGNERGLDVLQEHIHHHDNQKYRLDKRPYDRIDGGIQELVGIGQHHKLRTFRQVAFNFIEHLVNLIDGA